MSQKYFKGFKFTEERHRKLIIKTRTKRVKKIILNSLQREEVNLPRDGRFNSHVIEYLSSVSLIARFLPAFEDTLERISQEIGQKLDMDRRKLLLLPSEELKPKTEEEANRLVARYGEYMRNGGIGDCLHDNEGNFTLRVGIDENRIQKAIVNRDLVLDLAAHEYGHSLGETLDSAVFEELKAYAFASLFQRNYSGSTESSYKRKDFENFHKNRPHHVAKFRLAELLSAGIPEGAIISHLIGKKFGKFDPTDYMNYSAYLDFIMGHFME